MVKHIELVLNKLKDTSCFTNAAKFAEQADDNLGVKQMLSVETVFDDKGKDLIKLFLGSAVL